MRAYSLQPDRVRAFATANAEKKRQVRGREQHIGAAGVHLVTCACSCSIDRSGSCHTRSMFLLCTGRLVQLSHWLTCACSNHPCCWQAVSTSPE